MNNVKYIKKVVLPKNEECIFVDKTWRESPAFKITRSNILNWNNKIGNSISQDQLGRTVAPLDENTLQIPLQYLPIHELENSVSPQVFLSIYLSLRNDEQIRLKDIDYNQEGYSEYNISSKVSNVIGEIANSPVSRVKLTENMLNTEYEIYFVADYNFTGIYVYDESDESIEPIKLTYLYSEEEQDDFTFEVSHLYKIINGRYIKDCSNSNTVFTNGIHQKEFDLSNFDLNDNNTVGEAIVGQAIVG